MPCVENQRIQKEKTKESTKNVCSEKSVLCIIDECRVHQCFKQSYLQLRSLTAHKRTKPQVTLCSAQEKKTPQVTYVITLLFILLHPDTN